MKSYALTVLKFLIGWPLSLLALFFIAKLLAPQLPTLLMKTQHIDLSLLGYGILAFIIFFFIRGFIWHQLLKDEGYKVTFRETCFLWASSELKRYIPGNLWSFLGRSVLFSERGVSKKDIASNLLIEIELLVIGAGCISLLALPMIFHGSTLPIQLGLPIFAAVILLGLYSFNHSWRLKLSGKPRTVADFLMPKNKPLNTLFLIFLSSVSFLFFGLAHYLTFVSFLPLDPQLIWQLSGFCVFAFLLGYLSIVTPSGLGVREGILIWGLSKVVSVADASFLAIFARIIFVVSEVIFVALTLLWHKIKGPWINKLQTWIGNHKQFTILIGFYLIYVLYFSTITFLRYDNFYTGRFDLGNMAQTLWNTTQGRFFQMTNPNGSETVSRLAFHADFVLALLAPFYLIWANPKVLLLIQTIVLGAGAFFVYVIAKEIVKNKNLSLLFAVLFLLNPSVQRTNIYDFHAVTLATTFLLATFYFFYKKRYGYFLLFAFLAGICKEQVWFIVGLFGLFLFFWHKKRLFGTILFFVSIALSYFLISVAIPNSLGAQHFALEYYSEFGDSPAHIFQTMLFSPGKIIAIVLQPDRIDYLKQLFSPLGYLSILAPIFLLFALPDLIINLLSNNKQLHQIYYQYPATITPFLFIAAIYGVKVLLFLKTKNSYIKSLSNDAFICCIMIYLFTSSLFAAYSSGPLPGSRQADIDMITNQIPNHQAIDAYLTTIDPNAKITASNNLASHLSEHEHIFVQPLGLDKADYIMFLFTDAQPASSLTSERALVKKLKDNPQYKLVLEQGSFVVFKKSGK